MMCLAVSCRFYLQRRRNFEYAARLIVTTCVADCCMDCLSILDLLRSWFEISIEITIRITVILVRSSPVIILILGCCYVGYRLKYHFCGYAKAVSGNTIKIGKRTVRIFGIVALRQGQQVCWASGDCQDGFAYSKKNLAKKVDGRWICCRVTNWNGAYGRVEARCWLGKDDLGKWQLREGHAFADLDYSDRYVIDEAHASKFRQGFHDAILVPGPPKSWADSEAKRVLIARFHDLNLPGDPCLMTIAELRMKVGVDLDASMLIDPKGVFGPIELG